MLMSGANSCTRTAPRSKDRKRGFIVSTKRKQGIVMNSVRREMILSLFVGVNFLRKNGISDDHYLFFQIFLESCAQYKRLDGHAIPRSSS